jgi:hypothetical protein
MLIGVVLIGLFVLCFECIETHYEKYNDDYECCSGKTFTSQTNNVTITNTSTSQATITNYNIVILEATNYNIICIPVTNSIITDRHVTNAIFTDFHIGNPDGLTTTTVGQSNRVNNINIFGIQIIRASQRSKY